MTRWGLFLLVLYLVLALSRGSRTKAVLLAVGLTTAVIGYEMVKTLH
jgi:hypothetical protein